MSADDFDFMASFHRRAGNVFLREEVIQCVLHGDSQSKVYQAPDGSLIGVKCGQCAIAESNERAAEQARVDEIDRQKRHIEQSIGRACIPERFKTRTLDNYEADSDKQKAVLEFCRQYADNFTKAMETGASVIFAGGVGTGKTHLSIGIAHRVIQSGHSVIFTSVSSMIRRIRSTWKNSDENESDAMDVYINPDLLILDEVGVQSGSDNEHQILFEILNSRYENCSPTVLLTNLPIQDREENGKTIKGLKSFVGDRVLDRMREGGGKAFTFDWQSGRVGR